MAFPTTRILKSLVLILGLTLILGLLWAGLQLIPVSRAYAVRAEFAELPADDRELEQWLCSQPGVVKAFVERDGKALRVYWIMTQSLAGEPHPPALELAWERMGYESLNPKTVDWNWHDK